MSINAKKPYTIKYTNPQNNAIAVVNGNTTIDSLSQKNFIANAYYHPLTGLVLGCGVDDFVGIIKGPKLSIYNCRTKQTLLKTVTLPTSYANLELFVNQQGQVHLQFFDTSKLSLNTSLFNILQTFIIEKGYNFEIIGNVKDIAIEGINIPSNLTKDYCIDMLSQMLAIEIIDNLNNSYSILPLNLEQAPIYIEEQEHAFAVAYNVVAGDDSVDLASLQNSQLNYIKTDDFNHKKTLIDLRTKLTNSNANDLFIFDTNMVCDDDTANLIKANITKTRIYRATARKQAIITTTTDYIRLEVGDLAALNRSFYIVKEIKFDKGTTVLHLDERAVSVQYPSPPNYTKPPIAPLPPAPPPPLSRINLINLPSLIFDDAAQSSAQSLFFVYYEPDIPKLSFKLNKANVSIAKARLLELNVDLAAQSAAISLGKQVFDDNVSGLVVLNQEVMQVQAGRVIARSMFATQTSNHVAGTSCYLLSVFHKLSNGSHSITADYLNLYSVINAKVNAKSAPVSSETYQVLGGTMTSDIKPTATNF